MFARDNVKNEAIQRDFLIFRSWHNIKNEAILRDFFIFWTWQHPKRSNSARLLQFLNLTTSKTKQFCETSFKNGKLRAELTASCQCVLRFLQSTCRSTAPAKKKWCQVIRSAAPVTQNHLSKPEDLMLQNATHLRKSAPSPPKSSAEDVSCNVKSGLINIPLLINLLLPPKNCNLKKGGPLD